MVEPEAVAGRLRPVLVGGTGRSGSTIVGHLLDQHRDLTMTRPMEVRFLAGNDGLADALAAAGRNGGSDGARSAARLAVDRIRNRWFERAPDVGLHTSMTRAEIESWTDDYLADFDLQPLRATQTLTYQVFDRIAERLAAARLVDTTPANARKADRVEPVYPNSTVVIVCRDGRDVAASFVSQSFGPDDVFDGLAQWEERSLRIHRAARRARPERVVAIDLLDLVVRDRRASLERLCHAIGVDVDPRMVAWFDANVSADGMHPGRWRNDFDAATTAAIDEHYAAACARLRQAGVDIPG